MTLAGYLVALSILCFVAPLQFANQGNDPILTDFKHSEENTEEEILVFSFGSGEDIPTIDGMSQKGRRIHQTAWSREDKRHSTQDKENLQPKEENQRKELHDSWNLQNIVKYFLSFYKQQEGSKDIFKHSGEEKNYSYLENVLKYFLSFVYKMEDEPLDTPATIKQNTEDLKEEGKQKQKAYSTNHSIKTMENNGKNSYHEHEILSLNQSNNKRRQAGPALSSLGTYFQQQQVVNWLDAIDDDIEEFYFDDDDDEEICLDTEDDEEVDGDGELLEEFEDLSNGNAENVRQILEQNTNIEDEIYTPKINQNLEPKHEEQDKILRKSNGNSVYERDRIDLETNTGKIVCNRKENENCKDETSSLKNRQPKIEVKIIKSSELMGSLAPQDIQRESQKWIHEQRKNSAAPTNLNQRKNMEIDHLFSEQMVKPAKSNFAEEVTEIPTVFVTPDEIQQEIKRNAKSQKVYNTILEYIYKNYNNPFFLSLKGNSSSKSSL